MKLAVKSISKDPAVRGIAGFLSFGNPVELERWAEIKNAYPSQDLTFCIDFGNLHEAMSADPSPWLNGFDGDRHRFLLDLDGTDLLGFFGSDGDDG